MVKILFFMDFKLIVRLSLYFLNLFIKWKIFIKSDINYVNFLINKVFLKFKYLFQENKRFHNKFISYVSKL